MFRDVYCKHHGVRDEAMGMSIAGAASKPAVDDRNLGVAHEAGSIFIPC
ncbi:MAG: hypothetical protein CM1200mP3_11120 [Chloroflexota bacterium]|nr:MAG: hypothetical protein CM1200mP3_11120 [Chloroflexota bacterium]